MDWRHNAICRDEDPELFFPDGGGNAALARRLGAEALPKKHPELCHRCGDAWFMDPGVPATAQYVAGICREIVERYDVDGIHLDYIRYPEESVAWKDQATYRK